MEREFRDVKLKTPKSWISIGNFLIPKEQLADFGNYYAGFGRYQDFNFPSCCDFSPFFSKRGEVKSLTSSQIPFQYKKFFKKPITAEIFYIGKALLHKLLICFQEFRKYKNQKIAVLALFWHLLIT